MIPFRIHFYCTGGETTDEDWPCSEPATESPDKNGDCTCDKHRKKNEENNQEPA